MTAYVFDQLTDTNDFNVSDYSPAYWKFLNSVSESGVGPTAAQSISPNGDYVAGSQWQDTAWVVKTTPAGSPTLEMKAVFDGVMWSNQDEGFQDQDIAAHCVDDDGFIWGTSNIWGTDEILPQPTRHRGVVGYIDPASPSLITKAFSWTNNPTGDPDDFSIKRLNTHTLPDGTIKVVAIPSSSLSDPNYLLFEHTKGELTATVHDCGTWVPDIIFQDDNGDIWASGVQPLLAGTIDYIGFLRLTDYTGSSSYPAAQEIPIDPVDWTFGSLKGFFRDGFFIGGWPANAPADIGYACGTLIKIALDGSETVVTADVSDDPLLLPNYTSVGNPTNYFVQKANDPERNYIWAAGAARTFYALEDDLTLGISYDLDSWTADDLGDGAGHDIVSTSYWSEGRQAFMGIRYQWLLEDGSPDPDTDRMVADLFIYYFGEEEGGGGGGGGDRTIRVWTFSLDDHDFAVFRLGTIETLIYDLKTDQWSQWKNETLDYWRPHTGQNWVGMTETLGTYETDVVAGDDSTGILWVLDPTMGRDDLTTTGDEAFTRKVTGGIALNGRETKSCGALEITLSLGAPTQTGAYLVLKTSDDLGHTWINHGNKYVSSGDYTNVVEWRALGIAKQPGRVFEISDNGATVRIGRADLR